MDFKTLQISGTVRRFGLDKLMLDSGCVIAGYSGGADSSCLLRFLFDWCRSNDVRLAAAHVNHMIRGAEADRDEEFCRDTCERLGIPFYSIRADVPSIAEKNGCGIEEAARNVRYSFFDRLSLELTGSKEKAVIATAHNSGDNLETVLFNLVRGSGLRGMTGIDPMRDNRYIRPLICDSGHDIRNWCAESSVDFVVDSTNTDTDYTRNYIRHEIVPRLYKISDSPEKAASRMTALLRQDSDYIEAAALNALNKNSRDRLYLKSLHPAILSRVIQNLYAETVVELDISADKNALSEKNIREIIDKITGDIPEAYLSLPGNVRLHVDRHSVVIEPIANDSVDTERSDNAVVFTYPLDGDTFENDYCVIKFSPDNQLKNAESDENIYKLSICKSFCFDKIENMLSIRYRQSGDTLTFGGIKRRVKKLFIDKKLTAAEKASIPILCLDDEVIWIPGFPTADSVTENALGENVRSRLFVCCYIKK